MKNRAIRVSGERWKESYGVPGAHISGSGNMTTTETHSITYLIVSETFDSL